MNPFKYGGVVSGKYFYNRITEIKQLKSDLKSGNNLILYAPRRFGKTSLIKKVLIDLNNEGINTVYLDFFNVIDRKKFIELYAKEILNQKKFNFEDLTKKFIKFVKSISPSIKFDSFGNTSLDLNFSNYNNDKSFNEIVNLPEKWGGKKEKWVVVFDEFQEINKLNGDNFEKQLRSIIQFHQNVTYVFMGSKTHLLLNMFRDKKRAFYNIGKQVKIKKIQKKENIRFIKKKLKENNVSISEGLVEYIIDVTENIPYYIQFLASEVWQNSFDKKNITKTIIDNSIQRIIDGQSDYYLELYDKLSKYQKQVLLALVQSGENIYSMDYSKRFNLSSGSSTQRAVKKLLNEGIVEKEENVYEFSDPFFKRYLQLRFKA